MFYISLPYFYQNYKFNNFFKKYIRDSESGKESKLISKFNIEYTHGAFPWSLWNGDINLNAGTAVLTPQMVSFINQTETILRLDASNIYLQENDYLDIHENSTLRIINGTNNVYEISSIDLMNYLQQYNLNNQYIISNNAQILCPFNENILNTFIEQDNIKLINIGYRPVIDLTLIQNKSKLEVSIGYCGNCSMDKCLYCSSIEQQNIYNYSGASLFINCPYENKIIDYYEELLPFYKQGINHFKITANASNLNILNINIIKSFVKPEYQGECIHEYYKYILE